MAPSRWISLLNAGGTENPSSQINTSSADFAFEGRQRDDNATAKEAEYEISHALRLTTPKMPSRPTGGSSSESDSDVPESFSLAESKKSAKRKNEEIQKAHRAIKRQGKLKNQERDRTLKEQAKRRKESVNKERNDAVVDTPGARMERAMKEAQEEGSGGGDSEGGEQDGFSGLGVEDEIASEDEDMASGESSSDGMDVENEEVLVKKPPKHLPDHLFEAAFTSQNARLAEASNSPIRTSRKSKEAALSSKKKKRKEQSKDMVIGYDYFPLCPVPALIAPLLKITDDQNALIDIANFKRRLVCAYAESPKIY